MKKGKNNGQKWGRALFWVYGSGASLDTLALQEQQVYLWNAFFLSLMTVLIQHLPSPSIEWQWCESPAKKNREKERNRQEGKSFCSVAGQRAPLEQLS